MDDTSAIAAFADILKAVNVIMAINVYSGKI